MTKYVLNYIKRSAFLFLFITPIQGMSNNLFLEKPLLFIWRTNIFAHSLVAKDKKIVVSEIDGNISVLSAVDGKTLWKVNYGGKLTIPPVINNSSIIYPTSFSTTSSDFTSIRSLSLETGTTNWKKDLPYTLESFYANEDQPFIYCILTNSTFVTLNKTNGEIIDTVIIPTKQNDKIFFINEKLLCIVNPDSIAIFSVQSKTILWKSNFLTKLNTEALLLKDYIILATNNNFIFAVNSMTGKLAWKKKVSTKPQSLYLANNGFFVTNTENYIFFLNAEGKLKWKKLIEGRFNGYYLTINTSILLFPQSNDTGIILDLAKGNILNRLQINNTDYVQIPPVATDKFLIIQTQNGLEAYSN